MEQRVLQTDRFLLDQPVWADVERIAEYCADPVFEAFMTTPWPYERRHAEFFVDSYAPDGWASGEEWTWSIREGAGRPLLGVVGVRLATGMVGYWLGAPHRGRGVVPEALATAIDAVFEGTERVEVRWECVVGNRSSMRVAQKTGFRYTGRGPALVPHRDGSTAEAWTGRLLRDDPRTPKPGWPA